MVILKVRNTMKWFKHESAANMDAKLQEILLDYGLEGYGLYWYCLELVAGNVEPGNLNFELEHDCRIIARNTGSTPQRVQEMMSKFVEIGLFENSQGTITCLKMARVSDDYTAKLIRSSQSVKKPQAIENKGVPQSPTKSDKDPLEENRTEENRLDNNNSSVPPVGVTCVKCGGSGMMSSGDPTVMGTWNCPSCNGTGKTPMITDDIGCGLVRTYPDQPTPKQEKPKRVPKWQQLVNTVRGNSEKYPALNCINDDLMEEWAKLRTKRNASSTERALTTIESTLETLRTLHRIAPDTAIAEQCNSGWSTVKVEYFVRGNGSVSQNIPQAPQTGWSAGLENEVYRGKK